MHVFCQFCDGSRIRPLKPKRELKYYDANGDECQIQQARKCDTVYRIICLNCFRLSNYCRSPKAAVDDWKKSYEI